MNQISNKLRILTLIRLDAQRLFERIKEREIEYMHIFSSKRTREHFPRIFDNRYNEMKISELKICEPETIVALDTFYHMVDEMRWYLYCTEDMPGTVQDNVGRYIHELEELHQTLQLYLNADLESRIEENSKLKEGENLL